jgi:protein unc-80
LQSESGLNIEFRLRKKKEKMPIIDYIYDQIQNLNQIPLLVLCKSILILTDDLYLDLIKITWNLLLNSDQEIASAAGF